MNKWIFIGSLGIVFLVTLKFSYGPGYGGKLLAFLNSDSVISPTMSPSDLVSPLVTLKKMVTLKTVTNVTSVSPLVSPLALPNESQHYSTVPSVSPVVTSITVTMSPTPSAIQSVSPMSPSRTSSPTMSQPSYTTPLTGTPSSTPAPELVSPSPTPAQNQSNKININTADLAGLDGITGVGPVIAQRIIDYRIANGPFQKIEDIIGVKGIGDATFQKMKDQITVGP